MVKTTNTFLVISLARLKSGGHNEWFMKASLQDITYQHPFGAVTASLWSKYDGHKYVKEVDVLERYLDAEGRLHSKRLLSMSGNLPAIFKPFVPVRSIYMLETVVVDAERQIMTVSTQNINMSDVVEAHSDSRYSPVEGADVESTLYQIKINVLAFPSKASVESPGLEDGAGSNRSTSGVGVRSVSGAAKAYLSTKLEGWVVNKLLGNVNKGEKFIDSFCQRWRSKRFSHCIERNNVAAEAGLGGESQAQGFSPKASANTVTSSMGGLPSLPGDSALQGTLGSIVSRETHLSRMILRRCSTAYQGKDERPAR